MRSLLIRSTAGCLEEGRVLSRMSFRSTESTQDIPGNGSEADLGEQRVKILQQDLAFGIFTTVSTFFNVLVSVGTYFST